jgi:branched-chain amino acid transport system permease protein
VISTGEIAIAATSIVLLFALQYLLYRTRIGVAIRAVSSNLVGAQFAGININRVIVAVFVVASMLGAAAGMMVSLAYGSVSSFMGLTIIIKAFVVMVVGGLNSLPGSVVAGILIGVAEAAAGIYMPSAWTEMVGYGILLLTLLLMPRGLFGRA